MTQPRFDICAVGNAIVDVIAPCDDAFLAREGLSKGGMMLIDEARAVSLYDAMATGMEASGGSAGNTIAGAASFGGRAAYIGKVANDDLGSVYRTDMRAIGAVFDTPELIGGAATGRSLINVTEDGQRTMSTFLGAANQLTPDDIDGDVVEASEILYLEGYLFDPSDARAAFERAADVAHAAGRRVAVTLSDTFVVDRWRDELRAFIETSCDIVLANEAELLSLFQLTDFEAALSELRAIVDTAAVTRSEKGSVVVSGDERIEIAAYPVGKVVDTTGAGDQYAAGFLLGLARGWPLETCGKLGSVAAAEVIAHWGPRPQVSLRALAEAEGLI
ncbi:adenosine kinase [Brevundimonas aveniformis]|uniref:adenosine kinase n=1 Tax=Brevundimonas aveniformis TaxID=370977 RepID=UPI002490723C|nr:adenosine kinase [Brevundimonas aveniformis]